VATADFRRFIAACGHAPVVLAVSDLDLNGG